MGPASTDGPGLLLRVHHDAAIVQGAHVQGGNRLVDLWCGRLQLPSWEPQPFEPRHSCPRWFTQLCEVRKMNQPPTPSTIPRHPKRAVGSGSAGARRRHRVGLCGPGSGHRGGYLTGDPRSGLTQRRDAGCRGHRRLRVRLLQERPHFGWQRRRLSRQHRPGPFHGPGRSPWRDGLADGHRPSRGGGSRQR